MLSGSTCFYRGLIDVQLAQKAGLQKRDTPLRGRRAGDALPGGVRVMILGDCGPLVKVGFSRWGCTQ
jgi:hypothetical protein